MLNVYEFATVSELGLPVVFVGGGGGFFHGKLLSKQGKTLRILVARRNHLQETSVAAYLSKGAAVTGMKLCFKRGVFLTVHYAKQFGPSRKHVTVDHQTN